MTNLSPSNNLLTLANSGCKVNEIDIDELFQYYYSTKFIYAAKAKRLVPYMPIILEHLKKALKAGEDIIRIISYTSEDDHFASAMLYRYTDTTWVGQHLISTGSRISHIPMLGIHGSMIEAPDTYKTNNLSCWYRPDNKLPNLFFGASHDFLGHEDTSLTSWNYYECNKFMPYYTGDISIEDCTESNYASFEEFARKNMDKTWFASEEFNPKDIELEGLNSLYNKVKLNRSRKILLAYQKGRDTPAAIALCNKASLGMNLSFLENRVMLLYQNDLSMEIKASLTHALLHNVTKVYSDLPLEYIPLLVSDEHKDLIEREFAFPFFKKYNQSTWADDVYPKWYSYVQDLTMKYEATLAKKGDWIRKYKSSLTMHTV